MKSHMMDVALFRIWLNEKRMIAESTIHVYCEAVERFLKGNPDVDKLEDYNNFIIAGSIKKRCYHYYSSLRAFAEFKNNDANTRSKILEGMIRPTIRNDIKQERKYLEEDKIVEVINSLEDPKHRVVALIQTLTGVRAGDILRLKRDNIMPEEYNGKPVLRMNITGKGNKRNVIYIHDEIAQEVIMDYITTVYNHEEYYFLEQGKMKGRGGNIENQFVFYRQNYLRFWQDLKQALQTNHIDMKDFATHDMRRCFARRAWLKWKDIQVLQRLLNHSNPATTMKYLAQSGLQNIDHHYEMQMGTK